MTLDDDSAILTPPPSPPESWSWQGGPPCVARATPTQWHPPPARIGPFLEVPDQRDEVRWERIAHEPIEHPARIRPPIHVVAERDGRAVAGGARVEVASNVLDHPVEQV